MEEIDAQRVYGYALFKNGKRIRLAYPLEKFHTDVSGRSFHNGRFIQRMREKAASLPKYILQIVLVYVITKRRCIEHYLNHCSIFCYEAIYLVATLTSNANGCF